MELALLKNEAKLAAIITDKNKESSWSNQSRNTVVPGIQEENITQVSEEVEVRVTNKLSQELRRTERRSLGAL